MVTTSALRMSAVRSLGKFGRQIQVRRLRLNGPRQKVDRRAGLSPPNSATATPAAYTQAVREFLAWCEDPRVPSVAAVQPVHVAGYIEELTGSIVDLRRYRWLTSHA